MREIGRIFRAYCHTKPVSYTHLDVYKRQGPEKADNGNCEARTKTEWQRATLNHRQVSLTHLSRPAGRTTLFITVPEKV